MHDLCFQLGPGVDAQQTDRNRELESSRSTRAGVEVEYSLALLDHGPVRMATENGGELRSCGVEMERPDIVQQIEVVIFEEQNVRFRKAATWAGAVDVAAHCVDRCDLRE